MTPRRARPAKPAPPSPNGKSRLGRFLDTWPKRVIACATVVTLVGVPFYGHFAKTWQFVAVAIKQDKTDLWRIRDQIFLLEQAQGKRRLSPIEKRRLQDLKKQEGEIEEQIKEKQRRKGWW